MKSKEHKAEAERLIEMVKDETTGYPTRTLMQAQVHATLAKNKSEEQMQRLEARLMELEVKVHQIYEWALSSPNVVNR